MAVIYLFEQFFVKGKDIEADTFDKLGICSLDYGMGVLTVLHSINFISFKISKSTAIPLSCSKVIEAHIHKALLAVIEVLKKGQPDEAELLRKRMAAIEAHVA